MANKYDKNKPEIVKTVAENIIIARTLKKMSQASLGDKANISRPTMFNLEKGRTAARVDMLSDIATVLEKDLTWFFIKH